MENLQFGDLVEIRKSQFDKGFQVNFGLVYDVKGNELQLLVLSQIDNQGSSHQVRITRECLLEGNLLRDYLVETDKIVLAEKRSIARKVAKIDVKKTDEILRRMAKNIAEKHYDLVHEHNEHFIPGKTYIRYAGRVYDAEEIKSLFDSSLDFWLTAGRFSRQFEEEFAEFLGAKHCILTNSGSSANLLAISSLTSQRLNERRLRPGDEVITTACAFPTTVNPIIQNNLVPAFLDVDLETYNVQPDKIEQALSDKTKALFLAHTLGNPFDLRKVLDICEENDLWLIEDSCDALGSKYSDRYTGTFGHISTFSFYPAHHITLGEGGALVTDDKELRTVIISFRDWGRDCWCEPGHDNTCGKRFGWQLGTLPYGYDHKYIYSHIGYNLKITDMQAAIGVSQLRKLSGFIEARKRNWTLLYERLKRYGEHFILPKATDDSDPSWFGFILTIREDAPFSRNQLVGFLEENKIATRLLFSGNIIRHPSFESVKYRVCDRLDNTDFITSNTFWIGVYPGITKEMIEYILSKFDEFLKKL